jgi:hypothetical protein
MAMLNPLFLTLYLISFLPPLAATSWRSLGWTFLGSVVFVFGLVFLTSRGGGFVIFAFGFVILVIAAGLVAGCATKAVLLSTNLRKRPIGGAIIILFGASVLPLALEARSAYFDRSARAAYARLPTAESLPPTSACELYRSSSPLLDAVVAYDVEKNRGALTGFDAYVRYPVDYLSHYPPRFPIPMQRERRVAFQMHISDASPVRREEETDATGRWIPYDQREPAVSFKLLSREPVGQSASRRLRLSFGELRPLSETPKLHLAPSPYSGLQEVKNEAVSFWSERDRFVALRAGAITELVTCNELDRVPNPSCTFQFDHLGVAVEGSFRRVMLSEWQGIKGKIEDFVKCILVEWIPVLQTRAGQ